MDLKAMTAQLQQIVNKRFEPDAFGTPYVVSLKTGESEQQAVLSVVEGSIPHDHMHMPSIEGISYAFLAAAKAFPDVDFKIDPHLVSAEKAQNTMEVVL